ncbi:hypothetical protein GCM10010151_70650 [Actinoallomurus spadix]|uniref:Uncharacterized protein n=1 Tax=Actinoallomurus spadix TaxID=79912 RepID=A0ABN0XQY6_9ACTN
MVDIPLGGGNCGGAAMETLSSGTGGGAIRAGRWKAILLIGWAASKGDGRGGGRGCGPPRAGDRDQDVSGG